MSSTAALGPHHVRTVNVSINSANKIHDDAAAARYGFRGGLVAGTLMYAHMTTPLVERLGAAWLDASVSELSLLQPAYDGENLVVEGSVADAGWRVTLRNAAGDQLALLETRQSAALPPLDANAAMTPADPGDEPIPIDWDAVKLNRPLRALVWSPTPAAHLAWCKDAGDSLALYRDGARPRYQPGLVLQGANDVFARHFRLGPWIHTGSRIVHRGPLGPGDPIEIRAVPIEKWERKGHQFVKLYVVFLNAGVPAVEVQHTAIFRLRAVA